MRYHSTKSRQPTVPAGEAILKGLPDDNGLFVPETLPKFGEGYFWGHKNHSLADIGFEAMSPFFSPEFPADVLKNIIEDTLSFPIPLVEVEPDIYSLELFHGPTLAFKDVGARFMARSLNYLASQSKRHTVVLVATSGDTGSAVAHGFYEMDNIDVVILYPSGKVSFLQEKQMTTLGKNIHALEIDGNFDDCQRMVKEAFLDKKLNEQLQLTSANSINIARFLPQSIYYTYALSQIGFPDNVVVSVPSGNYGNLTAGLVAHFMGLPVSTFVASSNVNNIVPNYLSTGNYVPRSSVATISNAMDVGDPSNFVRIEHLFNREVEKVRSKISGYSYDDEQTKAVILEVYKKTGYLMDPHGAVAYLGLKEHLSNRPGHIGIFLETAHPAKFKDTVEEVIKRPLEIPEALLASKDKKNLSVRAGNQLSDLKGYLKEFL